MTSFVSLHSYIRYLENIAIGHMSYPVRALLVFLRQSAIHELDTVNNVCVPASARLPGRSPSSGLQRLRVGKFIAEATSRPAITSMQTVR